MIKMDYDDEGAADLLDRAEREGWLWSEYGSEPEDCLDLLWESALIRAAAMEEDGPITIYAYSHRHNDVDLRRSLEYKLFEFFEETVPSLFPGKWCDEELSWDEGDAERLLDRVLDRYEHERTLEARLTVSRATYQQIFWWLR